MFIVNLCGTDLELPLSDEEMARFHITFKKIPRDIAKL